MTPRPLTVTLLLVFSSVFLAVGCGSGKNKKPVYGPGSTGNIASTTTQTGG